MISPGLNNVEETVSFQSLKDPSIYLYVDNYNVIFKSKDNSTDDNVFNARASFYLRQNIYFPGSVILVCYALPTYCIRQDGFQITLEELPEADIFPIYVIFNIILPAPNNGKKFLYYFCFTSGILMLQNVRVKALEIREDEFQKFKLV